MDELIKIGEYLEAYTKEITNEVRDAAIRVGEEAAGELKASGPKKTGKYAKFWKIKVVEGEGTINVTVHNSKYYRLTHLLENGHVNRDGSRTRGRPHIKPVEEKVKEEYLKAVEEAIRKGGS